MEMIILEICFKNNKLEACCTDAREAIKKYSVEMAEKIHQRMEELRSIDSIEDLLQHKIGGCHQLKGKRKEQYAMNLVHPYRLVFIQEDTTIQLVKIIDIVNYH